MISSMAVRKIIFLSVGGQRSLCQLSAKFSPINRILSSSSEVSEHRFPLRLDSRCLVVSTASSFSFQRRSSSPATRRFLASTASYCSNAFLASYSSCSSLLDRAARCAASRIRNERRHSASANRSMRHPGGQPGQQQSRSCRYREVRWVATSRFARNNFHCSTASQVEAAEHFSNHPPASSQLWRGGNSGCRRLKITGTQNAGPTKTPFYIGPSRCRHQWSACTSDSRAVLV